LFNVLLSLIFLRSGAMKRKVFFVFVLAALLCSSLTAGIVQYDCSIDSGFAIVSGGFGGDPFIEMVPIVGSFSLVHDTATNDMVFVNIDIPPFPFYTAVDWDGLEGTFDAPDISLVGAVPGFPDNMLVGFLTGNNVFLVGILSDGHYDGYQYECTIEATVVPEPATLSLFALGGMCLRRRRK
jgi:hypothetical protein